MSAETVPGPEGRRTFKVVCPHDCPDTCVMTVTVERGRAVAIGGDPGHRFTRGFLCAKVNPYLERVYSPDRILSPLKRVGGAKGSPDSKFEPINWDEALETIAAGLGTFGEAKLRP
jgi:anaerobic selenocysteine-containing dehydrogenase